MTSKRPAGLDAPALPPTRAEIAEELDVVAGIMQRTGERMAYLGGFGEIGDKGREMIGAADIARGWAKYLRKRRREP